MLDWGYILFWLLVIFAVFVIAFIVLLAFTTGFKRSGRMAGGLYALIGKPGEGKSYMAAFLG